MKKKKSFSYPNTTTRRRQWHPTPVLLPGKPHGWRSPVGCSPWGHSELDRTEQLHFHFSPSCIEERNGNPLQNHRDRGAWWAAVNGVAQGRTRLKRLSSSIPKVIRFSSMTLSRSFYSFVLYIQDYTPFSLNFCEGCEVCI